jgi:hypothetical protein
MNEGNPKLEYRNPKRIQIVEIRNRPLPRFQFPYSYFGFVSCFGFRISNFTSP